MGRSASIEATPVAHIALQGAYSSAAVARLPVGMKPLCQAWRPARGVVPQYFFPFRLPLWTQE